jgi:cardiolipin synthase
MFLWTEVPEGWPTAVVAAAAVVDILVRVLMLGIVPGQRRPTTALAWLLAIFFIPYVGLLVFLLFGSNRLSSKRRSKQAAINEAIMHSTREDVDPNDIPASAKDWVHSAVVLNRVLGSFPPVSGNTLELSTDYRESMRRLVEAIDSAEKYAHVQFYIVGSDPDYAGPVFDAMIRAAHRGVKVRFLYDQMGSWRIPGYRRLKRDLTRGGVDWHTMLPIAPLRWRWRRPDLRNHRKIVVVDGKVAFTGSQNLIEPGYKRKSSVKLGREWIELLGRIQGPLVDHLDLVFATDWMLETGENLFGSLELDTGHRPGRVTGQVVPSGPGFPTENNLRLFNTLIYNAQERIRLTSPYLVPDDSLLYALTTAAQRGVDVEVFVSARGDHALTNHAQQSYYQDLLDAGVKLYRYRDPMVLHTKCITVDDQAAIFGSSNFDIRSFSLNAEVSMMLLGSAPVTALNVVMDGYREDCTLLTREVWAQRSSGQKWLDNIARLSSVLQ